ncbi:MAG TPA: alkaline phosphatase family protein [Pyrinomonadaceae bacterium]|nr:alkaline phosphatase family protein [Pyrinomonadaceae bacterium]
MNSLKGKIEHVVVLMLENRSLDNMMGFLYPSGKTPRGDTFEGIAPNSYSNTAPEVGEVEAQLITPPPSGACVTNPDPDPGEGFYHVNVELNTTGSPPLGDNSGFLVDYLNVTQSAALAPNIMLSYAPEQVPVTSLLAREFAVSDQWFCSAPTETFPNRLYVAAGTSAGLLYDEPLFDPTFLFGVLRRLPTVFNLLSDSGKTWKSYFHDVAFNWVLAQDGGFLSPNIEQYDLHFEQDLRGDDFPAYAFIEPAYAFFPNDQHPPHDVTAGEALVADVYNRIRRSKYWEKTLLIITYDEHGGCYDHVTPPPAIPPDEIHSRPYHRYPNDPVFNFDRYGLRVPAIFVSPYIEAGTVVRTNPGLYDPPNPPPVPPSTLPVPLPFDHTTIIKTLSSLFDLKSSSTGQSYLTERDRAAPDLGDYLPLGDKVLDKPESVVPPKVPFHCRLNFDLSTERLQKFLQLRHLVGEARHEESLEGRD